jgi:hypothetical protein
MTSLETSHMKNVVNELSFLLVTHTTCFDIRFSCNRILKSGFSAEQILDTEQISEISSLGDQDE